MSRALLARSWSTVPGLPPTLVEPGWFLPQHGDVGNVDRDLNPQ